MEKILAAAEEVYAHACFRIPTGALNDLIGDAVRLNEPPSYLGRRMKVYERYLENTIRAAYDFSGTPIKIVVREKKEEE